MKQPFTIPAEWWRDAEYGAALLVLTELFPRQPRVWNHVTLSGIDFETILEEGGFSHGESIAIQVAWSLFNSGAKLDLAAMVSTLDNRYWRVVLDAIAVRRGQIKLQVPPLAVI